MSTKGRTAGLILSLILVAAAPAARDSAARAQTGAAARQQPASTCVAEKPGEGRYKTVKAEPLLGGKISGYPKWGSELLMTASGGLQPSYDVRHGGIHYTVATDQDRKVIEYISTSDPAFRTPEGLAAGDTLKRVLGFAKAGVSRERGWAFHARLPSGWSAAFVQGESMTEGELPPTARVCFFFKRGH